MSTTPATPPVAKKARKKPVRHEGARYRIALTKEDATLSLSIAPSANGYILRARHKSPQGLQMAVEQFGVANFGDSYMAAKKRVEELSTAAVAKGWKLKSKEGRAIEDLL